MDRVAGVKFTPFPDASHSDRQVVATVGYVLEQLGIEIPASCTVVAFSSAERPQVLPPPPPAERSMGVQQAGFGKMERLLASRRKKRSPARTTSPRFGW